MKVRVQTRKKFSSSADFCKLWSVIQSSESTNTQRTYKYIYSFKSTSFHSVTQFSHKHQWLEVWIKWICVLVWLKGEANTFFLILLFFPLIFFLFVVWITPLTSFLVIGLTKFLVDPLPRLPVGCPHVYTQACKMVSPYIKHTHTLTKKFGDGCSESK